jgi:hypothetical protein
LRRNVHERGGFAKRDAVNNGFHVERALTLMLSIGSPLEVAFTCV